MQQRFSAWVNQPTPICRKPSGRVILHWRVTCRSWSVLTHHSVDGVPGGISSLTACRAWAREW
jgi:hypothetical protein